jgi:hypothetical protein
MVLPIFSTAAIGVVDSACIYMQGLIDRLGEGYFTQFFTQSFFQAPVLKALMQPSSWRMDPAYEPSKGDASSFHVYNFLPCLRQFTAHPALLPAEGLTCLELKPLALFTSTWFRSMDVAHGFESAKFDHASMLGCRLRCLMLLLDRHPVQALWANQARAMTYVWFKSLGSLLYLFQRLASSSMWKDCAGFLPADPNVHICPYDGDGQHFLNQVQDFDADIILQWSRDRLRNLEAFCSSLPFQPLILCKSKHLASRLLLAAHLLKTALPNKRGAAKSAQLRTRYLILSPSNLSSNWLPLPLPRRRVSCNSLKLLLMVLACPC